MAGKNWKYVHIFQCEHEHMSGVYEVCRFIHWGIAQLRDTKSLTDVFGNVIRMLLTENKKNIDETKSTNIVFPHLRLLLVSISFVSHST